MELEVKLLAVLAVFTLPSAAGDYSTFIGGAVLHRVAGVAVDATGNTYVAGNRSTNALVQKLDPDGNIVLAATIPNAEARAIALDPAGNIYVAGSTDSQNFPVKNPLVGKNPGPSAGFIVKLAPDGNVIYSTYFWGPVNAIATDSSASLYVTGFTFNPELPVTAGMPARRNVISTGPVAGAFIVRVSPSGDRILYSGLIAGYDPACGAGSGCFSSTRSTSGASIAVDRSGRAYVAGNTNTVDLPTTPGAFAVRGIGAFVTRVNAAGNGLEYLTYIGSGHYLAYPFSLPFTTVNALGLDSRGNAYIAGTTSDSKFPVTPGALQTVLQIPQNAGYPPPSDAFIAKLRADGAGLEWATYLGGAEVDQANSIALDAVGNVWVTGTTRRYRAAWVDSEPTDFLVRVTANGSALDYSARFPAESISGPLAAETGGTLHFSGPWGVVSAFDPLRPLRSRIFGHVNAAAGRLTGQVVPGEVISIYGTNIGPETPQVFTPSTEGFAPKTLGGVQVLFDGTPAPLLYVSQSQINAVVPLSVGTSGRMQVTHPGGTAEFPVFRIPAHAEIFRNSERAALVNEDGTINSRQTPARSASIVSIWATGVGGRPGLLDGQIQTSANNYLCCDVQIVGRETIYAGSAPGMVTGIVQFNFRVPKNEFSAVWSWAVSIRAGGVDSQSVFVWVAPH